MGDFKFMIAHYIAEVWRRRWFVTIIAWVLGLAGMLGVMMVPDQFTSKATVFVDTQSILLRIYGNNPNNGLIINDPRVVVEQVRRIMYTKENINKLIKRADLDIYIESDQEREQMVGKILRKLQLNREGNDFYTIVFVDESPKTAQKIVSTLMDIFIEDNTKRTSSDDSSITFLERQMKEATDALNELNEKIADFQRRYPDELVEASAIAARRRAIEGNLRNARAERNAADSEVRYLTAQLQRTPQTTKLAGTAAQQSPQERRLADLQQQRDQMLLTMTPQHPDVINIERLIEQARIEAANAPRIGGTAGQSVPNEAYTLLAGQLQQAQAKAQALASQIADDEKELIELQEVLERQPEIMQKYNDLRAEAARAKTKVEDTRSKIDRARTSNTVISDTTLVNFRVVDPPSLPIEPSGPNRLLLFMLAMFAAFGVALALTFLRIQLRDNMPTLIHLRKAFDLPILGSVSLVDQGTGQATQRLVSNILALAALGLLILLYAAVTYKYTMSLWRPDITGIKDSLYFMTRGLL